MDEVTMYDYLLTVRVPLKAMDDMEAKQLAEARIKGMGVSDGIKLQRLVPGKPPEGVAMKITGP